MRLATKKATSVGGGQPQPLQHFFKLPAAVTAIDSTYGAASGGGGGGGDIEASNTEKKRKKGNLHIPVCEHCAALFRDADLQMQLYESFVQLVWNHRTGPCAHGDCCEVECPYVTAIDCGDVELSMCEFKNCSCAGDGVIMLCRNCLVIRRECEPHGDPLHLLYRLSGDYQPAAGRPSIITFAIIVGAGASYPVKRVLDSREWDGKRPQTSSSKARKSLKPIWEQLGQREGLIAHGEEIRDSFYGDFDIVKRDLMPPITWKQFQLELKGERDKQIKNMNRD
jgi:hypothetical protein